MGAAVNGFRVTRECEADYPIKQDWRSLDPFVGQVVNKPPRGFSLKEFMDNYHLKEKKAVRHLDEMAAAGLIRKLGKHMGPTKSGTMREQRYYEEIKEKT